MRFEHGTVDITEQMYRSRANNLDPLGSWLLDSTTSVQVVGLCISRVVLPLIVLL